MKQKRRIVTSIIYPFHKWMPEMMMNNEDDTILIARIDDISAKGTIHNLLQAMRNYANKLYPKWYGVSIGKQNLKTMPDIPPIEQTQKLQQYIDTHPQINQFWFKNMKNYKLQGEPIKLTNDFSDEIHLTQLELILGKRYKTIKIYISSKQLDVKKNYNGFAKAVLWFLVHSSLRIKVYIPDILKNHPDLISIMYNRLTMSPLELPTGTKKSQNSKSVKGTLEESENNTVSKKARKSQNLSRDEKIQNLPKEKIKKKSKKLNVKPFPDIIGAPHPDSPGELALYKYIKNDPVLKDLFTFNTPLTTKDGTKIIADLLWEKGKLIVEVDSFRYHRKIMAFEADRHRDYLLMISDYRVLRLTYNEIKQSIKKAGKKLHDVVKYLQQK
ncbi:MAG: endonuclease domain-containing protein [Planctomycetaceae bacterium]|jgi:very-short-patch-repair endonuclease|nr:endonuclease domain-containing protein [Planctomycetaceae bacterium]